MGDDEETSSETTEEDLSLLQNTVVDKSADKSGDDEPSGDNSSSMQEDLANGAGMPQGSVQAVEGEPTPAQGRAAKIANMGMSRKNMTYTEEEESKRRRDE